MQSAALIVGVGHSMIVVATGLMDVVVGVTRETAAGEIICDVLLGRGDMLEMDGDQRRNASNMGDQKQPKKPKAKASSIVQRNHLIGFSCHASAQARCGSDALSGGSLRPWDDRRSLWLRWLLNSHVRHKSEPPTRFSIGVRFESDSRSPCHVAQRLAGQQHQRLGANCSGAPHQGGMLGLNSPPQWD
jgi:hypothetical protein